MTNRRKTAVHVETVDAAACSTDLRLSILQQLPFFASLSVAEISEVNEQFREYGFQSGETIYLSGERAKHLHVIAAGQVKLLRHALSGQDVLLDILQPGDYFGSLTALDKGYADTAVAQTDLCVLRISIEVFRALLQRYPAVGLAVLDITAKRLREAQETVRRLSVESVEQRVAAVLHKLALRLGEITSDGILIQMLLSREDLAQMAGTTTETASRMVSQFQKDGLVHSGRQWIAIRDMDRLKAIAFPDPGY